MKFGHPGTLASGSLCVVYCDFFFVCTERSTGVVNLDGCGVSYVVGIC
jgi:hypothetical protein